MQRKTLLIALGGIILCELIGIIGALFTVEQIPLWYASLAKPSFSPPNWIFGPMWTALYALMGISLGLLSEVKPKARKELLQLFALQLFLNGIWTPVFFGLHAIALGFFVIVLLDISVGLLIAKAWRTARPVAWLLTPYLLWILFASVLNASLLILNP